MKPILFNTEMVRAILDGRKMVTRRKVDRDIINGCDIDVDGTLLNYENDCGDFINPIKLCRYQVGDVLYVRETFAVGRVDCGDDEKPFISQCIGENSQIPKEWAIRNNVGIEDVRWTPSIHMPKEAARIFLKVTSVKVERLQNMDEESGLKEGIPKRGSRLPIFVFMELWDSTIKKSDLDEYGWDANPWVWVIEFERCEKPESEVSDD